MTTSISLSATFYSKLKYGTYIHIDIWQVDDVLQDLPFLQLICCYLKSLDSKSLFKTTLAYP